MSSSGLAIAVHGLSKAYTIRHNQPKHSTLADTIVDRIKHPFRKSSIEIFWALRDITFELQRGEILGIVGRNGAGKSTLLKILSRIVRPTKGHADIHGRLGSLLEVGTGFHQELTGRENIFLNGSILGMNRREVKSQFDEIVAFAEVEQFIDTPVKRYSTGMYVRLAFAVAAHLRSEILVIDEVLAVGDIVFQKKCLGKMKEVAQGNGRTVLFVSHNMAAVSQLCSKGLYLRPGIEINGLLSVPTAIQQYNDNTKTETTGEWRNSDSSFSTPYFTPGEFYIARNDGHRFVSILDKRDEAWLYIKGHVQTYDPSLQIGYELFSEDGSMLYMSFFTDQAEAAWPITGAGDFLLRTQLPLSILNDGKYRIEMSAGLRWRDWFCVPGSRAPTIHFEIFTTSNVSPYWTEKRAGLMAPQLPWSVVTDCM